MCLSARLETKSYAQISCALTQRTYVSLAHVMVSPEFATTQQLTVRLRNESYACRYRGALR